MQSKTVWTRFKSSLKRVVFFSYYMHPWAHRFGIFPIMMKLYSWWWWWWWAAISTEKLWKSYCSMTVICLLFMLSVNRTRPECCFMFDCFKCTVFVIFCIHSAIFFLLRVHILLCDLMIVLICTAWCDFL